MAQAPDQLIRSSFLRRSSKTLTDRSFHRTTRQRTLHQPVSQSVSQSVNPSDPEQPIQCTRNSCTGRPLPSTSIKSVGLVGETSLYTSFRRALLSRGFAFESLLAKTTQIKNHTTWPTVRELPSRLRRNPADSFPGTRRPARETHSPAPASPPHCSSASVLWRVARLCRCRRSCFGGSAT
jgi:hypothetical protein